MHELSIAVSLVDLACEEAERLGGVRVDALHVRLGALSGVVKHALAFSFDVAAAGSAVDGARLLIEEVPVSVFCAPCGTEREVPSRQPLQCPVCATPTPDVVRGRECLLVALEVDDRVAPHC